MSNIDKRALMEAAEKAQTARARLESMSDEDVVLFEENDIKSDVSICNKFIVTANPATVLALLDELEAAEKRIAELEAREVALPTPYPKGCGMVADKYNFALGECADAIRAAGIIVKGNI